jgi:tetratricopeptide (TPR) repeat protein
MTWFSWWTLLPMQKGVQRAAEGDWPGAAALFEEAARRDAGMAATHQQAGLALSMQVDVGDDDYLEEAIIYYENAVAIDPYWGLNHANLGALYRSAGRVEEARAAFARAVRLSPKCETYHLNLGVVQEEMGQLAEAENSYFTVLSLKPDWAGSGFWRTGEFRPAALEKWQAANPAEPEKDLAAMKAVLKARPDAIAAYLPIIGIYLEHADLVKAQEFISRAQFAAGSNTLHLELGWRTAELAAARGEFDQAVEAGQKVIQAATHYGIFGPATPGNKIYNLFMFRRPAADVDFVPQLLVIDWTDEWGWRALTLAEWMEVIGDLEEADRWRQTVNDQIPDLAQP